MQKYLPKGIFKKYLEDTVLYLVSSEYFIKVSCSTLCIEM